jgi:phage-related protein
MAGQNLGTIRGTIEIDYDGAGIVRAIKDTDKLKKSSTDVDKGMTRVLTTFGKFAKAGAIVAASSLATHSALQLVAGTLAVLAPLAAAGLAILPGILAAAAGAGVILALSMKGVGDAFKAAGGDVDKFNKATAKLAPNAKATAVAYRAALPALSKVQKAIQNSFFSGLGSELTSIVGKVGKIQGSATRLAGALNGVVRKIAAFAKSNTAINAVNSAFRSARQIIVNMDGTIQPLLNAFAKLVIQAEKFSGAIGDGLAIALTKVTGLLNKVDLDALFARAGPIVQTLIGFFGDLVTIAGSLFSVFNVDGANAAGILGTLASSLATFLTSAQGTSALDSIGTALSAISTGAGQVFLALLQTLAPVLVALTPGITELATTVSGALVSALSTLNPLLVATAGFLSDNMTWLIPMAGVIVGIAAAYKTYAAIAGVVNTIKGLEIIANIKSTATWIGNAAAVIASTTATVAARIALIASTAATWLATAATTAFGIAMAIVTSPIFLVIAGIALLVAGIILLWKKNETFRKIVLATWNAIKIAFAAVVGFVTGTLVPAFVAAWKGIVAAFKAAWQVIQPAVNLVISIFKLLWAIVQAGAAIFALAFGIIMKLVGAFVSFLIARFNVALGVIKSIWTAVQTFLVGVWNAIWSFIQPIIAAIVNYVVTRFNTAKALVTAALNVLAGVIRGVLARIQAVWNTIWGAVSSFVAARFNFIKGVVSSVLNVVAGIVRKAVSTISNIFNGIRAIVDKVRNFFNQLRAAANGGTGSLIAFIKTIPGKILGALGNLGGLLFNKGKELVRGFINGIGDMIGAAKRKASELISAVTDFLPGSPAKTGPLSGKGYVLLRARRFVTDFAKGIGDVSHLPVTAMAGVVNPVAASIPSGGSGGTSGGSNQGSGDDTPRTFGPYQMVVDGKVLAEFVIDTVTGAPRTIQKTNAEGTRQVAWAGSGR